MTDPDKATAFLNERRTGVLAGTRKDGRPHLSPNWFHWDGRLFYISTMRNRVKFAIFSRDPRGELLVDDSTGHRALFVPGQVEIREDIEAELPHYRAIRDKHGLVTPTDEVFLASLESEDRVLLVLTPARPLAQWTNIDLD